MPLCERVQRTARKDESDCKMTSEQFKKELRDILDGIYGAKINVYSHICEFPKDLDQLEPATRSLVHAIAESTQELVRDHYLESANEIHKIVINYLEPLVEKMKEKLELIDEQLELCIDEDV